VKWFDLKGFTGLHQKMVNKQHTYGPVHCMSPGRHGNE